MVSLSRQYCRVPTSAKDITDLECTGKLQAFKKASSLMGLGIQSPYTNVMLLNIQDMDMVWYGSFGLVGLPTCL